MIGEKEIEKDYEIRENPLVDVAAYLFLEDIADKQGAAGMNNYLLSLATSLAKSMPKEEYKTWDDFVISLERGESIISTFESVTAKTKHCMVTQKCPFERGWREYTKRIGDFARVHKEVADYYNSTVKPGTNDTQCIICQTFRAAAAERITVAKKSLKYAQVAAIAPDGSKKIAPDEWKPILLEKAGMSETDLNMTLRNNACVWILY